MFVELEWRRVGPRNLCPVPTRQFEAMYLRIATALLESRASANAVLICATRSVNDESLATGVPDSIA